VAAVWVVPALDEFEDRQAGVDVGLEARAIEQLTRMRSAIGQRCREMARIVVRGPLRRLTPAKPAWTARAISSETTGSSRS
jgi:hypothetical protein